MCGIVGGFWIGSSKADVSIKMRNALYHLNHRGPNHNGVESFSISNGELQLGHTRLSIIDLSEAGHQPMFSKDKRFSIVFNGEIYNYRELRNELKQYGYMFTTDSDTEVLLAAWQHWNEDCLSKLIGMFGFVIFDNKQNQLTCVRDAFGIKPFFYTREKNNFFFASEIRALHQLKEEKPRPNIQRSYDYLIYNHYDSGSDTFFENTYHLPPSHLLKLDLNTGVLEKKKWWTPKITQRKNISFNIVVDEVRNQFLESIKLHLRSDVAIAGALSGGIDSSAIVCAMKYVEPQLPVHTFSYIANNSNLSEEHWVDIVNKHTNAISHKVVVGSRDLINDIDKMIYIQGEPFGSTSIYAQYKVFESVSNSGITVTLEGQGADELLAGYNGYPGYRLYSLIEEGRYIEAYDFLNKWSEWPKRNKKMAIKLFFSALTRENQLIQTFLKKMNGRSNIPNWLNKEYLLDLGVNLKHPSIPYQVVEKHRRVMMELANSLNVKGLPHLLRHGDRNSMAFSIESRVPFLTVPMADLLLSLPEEYLISSEGQTKHVFRAAMRGIVPNEILFRKDKIGFETPELQWFLESRKELTSWLSNDIDIEFLNTTNIVEEFNNILDGRKPFSWQVWRWLNYYKWYSMNF